MLKKGSSGVSRWRVLLLLLLGLAAGLVNGLLGAGGGILVVFGLRRLLRETYGKKAAYTGAIAVMLPLSALSAWRYFTAGHLPRGALSALFLPALLGGLAGAWLLGKISPRWLGKLFSALVLVSGLWMVF